MPKQKKKCFKRKYCIINAGISGDNSTHSGKDRLEAYKDNLRTIFNRLKERGSEVVFMTANMMNTYVSNRLKNERITDTAERTMRLQNNDVLGSYFEAAKETATVLAFFCKFEFSMI